MALVAQLTERADRARDAGQWAQAAVTYDEALKLDPGNGPILVQCGHMLKESGELAAAERHYLEAQRLMPQDSDLALQLGHFYKVAGRIAEAGQAYKRALDLRPDWDAPRIELLAFHGLPPSLLSDSRTPADIAALISESGLFDPEDYRRRYPDVEASDVDPLMHFVEKGGEEYRQPHLLFDTAFYLKTYPQVADIGLNPLAHFLRYGAAEGLDPNPHFDTKYYLAHNPDALRGGMNPLLHYLRVGSARNANPSRRFDALFYLANNPDLVRAGINPLEHYIEHGERENRRINAVEAVAGASYSLDHAEILCLKVPALESEMALFVAHSPDGFLKPHVRFYLDAVRRAGIGVILIVASDVDPARFADDVGGLVAGLYVRRNEGYDFAAWAHVLQLNPMLYDSERLYLMNDSLFGPLSETGFAAMMRRIRASPAGLVGMTDNYERTWHIQSFFLMFRQSALQTLAVQRFFNAVVAFKDKDDVINQYECVLAPSLRHAGLVCETLFASTGFSNATIFRWRELIDAGFPFVKVMTLRDDFPDVDKTDWRVSVGAGGYDLTLIDRTLAAAKSDERTTRRAGETATLATPAFQPPRVTFLGPWNYDNGLASASRGYMGAMRRLGLPVNFSPIRKSFHIHHRVAPSVDIDDFSGVPDVVVIHLNPDGWAPLLTDSQRDLIARAKIRIGLWVWEAQDLPVNWYPVFDSVDAIWTPSRYCADVFKAKAKCPVCVVPHVVVAESSPEGDASASAVRRSLDIAEGQRIILYVFDGSSYLVRKNPFALVRAFGRSGLAKQGWCLVLKTKHLFDTPAQGHALQEIAASVPGVILLDRSANRAMMTALMAAASVYASPHCSEGFGLTIAEAMAAGKIVVATDYSGSRDFVDASCAIPVAYSLDTLVADHGHYVRGLRWAQIDETALADALVEAARQVDAGDTRLGEAARAQIATLLSPDAVAARMHDSIMALWDAQSSAVGAAWSAITDNDRFIAMPLSPSGTVLGSGREMRASSDRQKWFVVAPADAKLNPALNGILLDVAAVRPDLDILYGGEVARLGEGDALDVILKPDFDLTFLQASDYLGYPLLVRASAMSRLGGLRPGCGTAAAYDLVLRAVSAGLGIGRLTDVLARFDRAPPRATVQDRQQVLQAWLDQTGGLYDVVPGLTASTSQIKRRFETYPDVTLVIPTRQAAPMQDGAKPYIVRLLDDLMRTDWPMDKLHVLVGDDLDDDAIYAGRQWPFGFRRIVTRRPAGAPFSYAAKMNGLWRAATTEHVVLMNDDLEIGATGWLRALLTFSTQDDVGAVGARLLYPNGTVQHAGMVGGLFGLCAHGWLFEPASDPTYQDWALVHRQWSMVTGAVCAMRRSVLEAVDGFDERFALEFNDVDLCLRIRMRGLRIVYTPFAELIHHEKVSRGERQPPGSELAMFLKRWSAFLEDDPASHPALARNAFRLAPLAQAGQWWQIEPSAGDDESHAAVSELELLAS